MFIIHMYSLEKFDLFFEWFNFLSSTQAYEISVFVDW